VVGSDPAAAQICAAAVPENPLGGEQFGGDVHDPAPTRPVLVGIDGPGRGQSFRRWSTTRSAVTQDEHDVATGGDVRG